MAAKKGATGRKRRTSSGGRKGTRKRNEPDRSMETEIILWIVLAMSAVLLISNFGFGGAVGNAISSFFFGLVGLVCYPLPFFLFLGTAFVISNSRNTRVYRKMAGFALLFITACMLMQMVTEGEVLEDNLGAYFKNFRGIQNRRRHPWGCLMPSVCGRFRNSRHLCNHPDGFDDLPGADHLRDRSLI